jgi:hypothetical protein
VSRSVRGLPNNRSAPAGAILGVDAPGSSFPLFGDEAAGEGLIRGHGCFWGLLLGVTVAVAVAVGVGVRVAVGVGVWVGVGVGVLVAVAVGVAVRVAVEVGVCVAIGAGVRVAIGVGVGVGVAAGLQSRDSLPSMCWTHRRRRLRRRLSTVLGSAEICSPAAVTAA